METIIRTISAGEYSKAVEEVGKELSVNKQRHLMSGLEVILQTKGKPRNLNTSTKPRSWDLKYPALTFMLNGG